MITKIPLILVAVASLTSISFLLYRSIKRLRRRIEEISACGYFADPPGRRSFAFAIFAARILTFIQVGKVHVIGRENLDLVEGPVIVCANHPHYIDAGILPILIKRPARYMVDEDVLRFGCGLSALFLVPVGAFPVRDGTRYGSIRACETGVQSLASGYPLLIFPEGHTTFDSKFRPFKKGAIRIAKMASSSLGKSVFIVPVFIRYGRCFGARIQQIKPPLQYLIVLLGSFYFRRGATIVFGLPISSEDLPANDKTGCALLAQNILALDPDKQIHGTDAGMYESFAFTKL